MGYQENLEFYLKMSRKELQKLCKQHDLPANKSHDHLAKSLVLQFEKRNAHSEALLEKSVNFIDGSSQKPLVSEPRTKLTVSCSEESARGVCRRQKNSLVDIHGQFSGAKEIPPDDRVFCQTSIQMDMFGRTVNTTLEKVEPQTVTPVLQPVCPANNNGTEGFSSSSDYCNMGMRCYRATDIQDIRANQLHGLECKEVGIRRQSGKLLEPSNADKKLVRDTITSRTCDANLVQHENNKAHEYSMESGLLSVDGTSMRVRPSFQFFVMSEGGINLYVDLNSSPSEWINSLKDDICVHQNSNQHDSMTVSRDTSDSPEVDHMKISPSADIALDLQETGVERISGCTNSSLSSVVSENCNSEAYPPDATVVTSGSSVLTSGSVPTGLSGCLEENQVFSSPCANYAAQNHLASDVASCPHEKLESANASFEIVKSNSPVLDASVKSVADMNAGSIDMVTGDESMPMMACTNFIGVGIKALSNTPNDVIEKSNLSMPQEIQDCIGAYDCDHHKNHSGACEALFTCSTNKLPNNASLKGELSNSCQLIEQMTLDRPMADAHSEIGAADGLFCQKACTNCVNMVLEVPASTFQNEPDQCTPMRGTDITECSRAQTSFGHTSKRSSTLETSEELPVKRQNSCSENTSGTIMTTKSNRSSAKEVLSDAIVMPRRSTRLVSKFNGSLVLLYTDGNSLEEQMLQRRVKFSKKRTRYHKSTAACHSSDSKSKGDAQVE